MPLNAFRQSGTCVVYKTSHISPIFAEAFCGMQFLHAADPPELQPVHPEQPLFCIPPIFLIAPMYSRYSSCLFISA